METKNGLNETKVMIGKVRLSYAHLFEPKSIDGDATKAKYSVSLIVPKINKALVAKIQTGISTAYQIGMSSKWGNKKPLNAKNPLRDGDTERAEDETYADCFFINASCKTRPGVNKIKGYETGSDGKRKLITVPVENEEEVYSGCYAYVSVNFYPFDASGSKGVACGLNNVLKVEDGPALGGRISAEADFSEVELPEEDMPFNADSDPFANNDACPF